MCGEQSELGLGNTTTMPGHLSQSKWVEMQWVSALPLFVEAGSQTMEVGGILETRSSITVHLLCHPHRQGVWVIWWEQLTPWKRPWCWGKLRAHEEEGIRGWDAGWHHQCNRHVWVNSQKWWRTERPGMLLSMGSHRVRHNYTMEQQQQHLYIIHFSSRRE